MKIKILEGWLGGHYDDLSLHKTKKDAARGLGNPFATLDDLTREFQDKRVRIIIQEIEEDTGIEKSELSEEMEKQFKDFWMGNIAQDHSSFHSLMEQIEGIK